MKLSVDKQKIRSLFALDQVALITGLFAGMGAVISHVVILSQMPDLSFREIHNLSMGLSYDLMNGAEIALLAVIISALTRNKWKKIVHSIILFAYLFLLLVDIFRH